MKTWTTINHKEIAYSDLETSHLKNIITYIEKRAKEGMQIISGGGSCAEDMWGEIDHIEGEQVKKFYDYLGLKEELKKRI